MMDGTGLALCVLIGIFVYFLPSFIASNRNHKNIAAIFVLNLLLGWMLLGWIVALIWSCTDNVRGKKNDI